VLLKEKPADDPAQASVAPGGRKKSKEIDICGIEPKSGRLLVLASSEDYQNSFKIKRSLLMKFPSMVLHTNLLDPHVYIISRWTLDWFEKQGPEKRHKGASLRHDIIPALLRSQYADATAANAIPHDPTLNASAALDPNSSGAHPKVPIEMMMASTRYDPTDRVFCQAFQLDSKPLCIRANNMATFMDANRDIATGTKFFKPLEKPGKGNFIAESATISPKTQVGTECVVSDSTTIGDRCGIKKSVIGKHCVIGNNVKIANSVLLDHVTVKDGYAYRKILSDLPARAHVPFLSQLCYL
jgi:translation initiation factor eIF-2B subunit gamma